MRSWLIVVIGAVLLVLAQPAFADKKAEPGATEKTEKPHERDMFEKALDLGIWTLVVFLILVLVLRKFAWGPILEGLDKREKDIAAAVEDSRKAREEAAAARQSVAEEQARSSERAAQIVEKARRDAAELESKRKAEFDAEIAAEKERFYREKNMARDQAIKEMWTQSAQLATLISSKVIGRQLSPDDHRNLVDEALADMNRAFEERQKALSAGAHA